MSNLGKRIVTAIVLVACMGVALFLLPPPAGVVFVGFFLLVGAWEWAGFFAGEQVFLRFVYVLFIAGLASLPFLAGKPMIYADAALYGGLAYWLAVVIIIATGVPVEGMLAVGLAGVVALLCAWYAVAVLFEQSGGAGLLVWCAAIVAAADIGAYFTGKKFGRRKLAPAISPGKTLEGFFGGLIFAAVIAALAGGFLGRDPLVFALAGLGIGALSVAGDLWVSRFKRAAGLKDSGSVLPGHGGVMDRVDSLIAALPVFALVVIFTTRASA